MSLTRELQERAARALPSTHTEIADGWWLRHAPGCVWWAGTVLPHRDGPPDDLARRIAEAEAFYAARGATARFQITPGACPDALDRMLAGRGYRRESPVSLQTASTAAVRERLPAPTLSVTVDDTPSPEWLNARAEEDLVARVRQPSVYARAVAGAETVAVGRLVEDDGWAGIFDMATVPHARGRGAARSVLAALVGRAASPRLYLQVELGNTAALRLYDRAGFTARCTYHYRTQAR